MKIKKIKISLINLKSKNSRIHIGDGQLTELMQSMKETGQLQAIAVKPTGKRFEPIFGFRRLNAAKRLGWDFIEAKVYPANITDKECMLLNISENLQRVDITPHEQGRYFNQLVKEFDMSYAQISVRCGISQSTVARSIDLFNMLPKGLVKELRPLKSGGISAAEKAAGTVLPTDVVYEVLKQQKSKRISQTDAKVLFEEIKKRSTGTRARAQKKKPITARDVALVSDLKQQAGFNIKKAISKSDDFRVMYVNLPFNRKKLGQVLKAEGLPSPTALLTKLLKEKYRGLVG